MNNFNTIKMNHSGALVTEYKMLAVTLGLRFLAIFSLPSSQTVANWMVSLSALVTIIIALHNKFFKKDKK